MKNIKSIFSLMLISFSMLVIGCKSDSVKTTAESGKAGTTLNTAAETASSTVEGSLKNGTDVLLEAGENVKVVTPSAGDNAAEAVSAAVSGATTFSINAAGDLLDGDGKLIAKAGEFSKKDGYYVDANGEKLGLFKKVGKAIEGAAGAVAGAATKSAEKMKEVFSGLFKSKEKVGSTYMMSKIVFDEESHRITDFSKGEVEGLAAALKAMPDAKIQVQVHGDAGNSVTGKRADVIKAMLVTLGVNKKQISSKGMGDGDAAKAAAGKVEIQVEQTVE